MRKILLYLSILALSVFFISCEKTDEIDDRGDSVEIYIISYYNLLNDSCEIVDSNIYMGDTAFVKFEDLLFYNPNTYTFDLTPEASQAMHFLSNYTYYSAFGVKVDDELIYTSYLWPMYYPNSCIWLGADLDSVLINNKMEIVYGYTGDTTNTNYHDTRNDSRIIDVFEKYGKLK